MRASFASSDRRPIVPMKASTLPTALSGAAGSECIGSLTSTNRSCGHVCRRHLDTTARAAYGQPRTGPASLCGVDSVDAHDVRPAAGWLEQSRSCCPAPDPKGASTRGRDWQSAKVRDLIHFDDGGSGMRHRDETLAVGDELVDGGRR